MHYLILSFFVVLSLFGDLNLKENFKISKPGDYVIAQFGKTNTLLRVVNNNQETLRLEEVTAPSSVHFDNWEDWLKTGAEGHTSWVTFEINLKTGELRDFYSFTRSCYLQIPASENFLSTLLSLNFEKIPKDKMKMAGTRKIWQPQLYFNGNPISGVFFEAWKTKWPQDDSDLSGKNILVYLPEEGSSYPSYFPYWLEISGALTKAKVRIIDTGHNLKSPIDTYLQSSVKNEDLKK